MRRPERRSKIVCTLGPAVSNPDAIAKLIEAGMDVARLNFSHGSHEGHGQNIRWIREASARLGIPCAILGDLQGPKIRTGRLAAPPAENGWLALRPQQLLWFTGVESTAKAKPGDGSLEKPIAISYPRLTSDLRRGDLVLFDDGLIRMVVEEARPGENLLALKVEVGTSLGENKGVNMPGAKLTTLGITEKDWDDILFATAQGVDFLALSFVRSAREVKNLKGFLEQKKLGIHVIAKIEKAEAVENIDEILHYVDGIMVARGDLGVEIGNSQVPLVQKQLIRSARRAGKPVITATQMLMSMVANPSPSRAEASDVANAVLDGSDALMLSNETATGQYPFEAVEMMASIIRGAETLGARDYIVKNLADYAAGQQKLPVSEAIEAAATSLANTLEARCLACLTRSGQAARQLAKYRPLVPIFAFAENEKVQAQLCLTWGVSVVPWKEGKSQDYSLFDDMLEELGRLGFLRDGDWSVMTAGIPTTRQVGTTNTVVVRKYPPLSGGNPARGR